MIKFSNVIGHFKTILIHKHYVFWNCHKAGLTWQGFKHDLSKFSPTEFCESIKYYTGLDSPINVCKKEVGVSYAWMHHKGRNPHHYEYWQDNFDKGGNPVKMPYKYAMEQICDFLGAGKAYMKHNFSYESEYRWWVNKRSNPIAMHPDIIDFTEIMLWTMNEEKSNDVLRPERALPIYLNCCKGSKNV